MPRPRKQLVSIDETPFYHLYSRCTRKAFLCGVDLDSGIDYSDRKLWIEERIHLLSSIFAIDVCGYAVMSNHYHIVTKLVPEQADDWSEDEVIKRWRQLFKGPRVIRRMLVGKKLSRFEKITVKEIASEWRTRLTNVSWFMKCLNEPLARKANKEDGCTGHFWESRFRSQALLNEEALLACMAYVDLNPIRAGLAKTPEASEHTSIRERLLPTINMAEIIRKHCRDSVLQTSAMNLKPLLALDSAEHDRSGNALPCNLTDYLQLLDWTGRAVRSDKPGYIPANLPPIFQRLNIEPEAWLLSATEFETRYRQSVREHLRKTA